MSTTQKRAFRRIYSLFVTAVCLCLAASCNPPASEPKAPIAGGKTPSKSLSQDEKMQWFREAKFGLFIHWGLYAIPAGTWKDRQIPGIGEWIMNRARIPVKEYEQLAGQFNPVKFNAEEWVQLAEDAGMKYIVITSKHHDGFAMYGSKASKYNIVDATPFHRDPLKELAAACAKHGIRFGFYYSQSQDWHEPGGAGNTWDFPPDKEKSASGAYDKYLREKAEPQVKELLTNYGPVCLIWFDTARMMDVNDRAKRFIDIVHTLQPACLIDGRLGAKGDYTSMGDNRIPNQVVKEDWEVPATLNNTWGYKSYDNNWKTPEDLTFKLVDIVSKGGNYLLNVGPTAEGVIPQPSQDNLRAVGRWLKVNGEAIYGAGVTPFGEELGTTAPQQDGGRRFVARTDWRCTTKPGKLFIHLFKWPAGSFELPVMGDKITKAYLLADPQKQPLAVKFESQRWTVSLPEAAPDKVDSVLVLETVPQGEIRTPQPAKTPRINGPSVFGVRPGSPVLYRIPATGERPMEFSVDGLPAGLGVNAETGQISGSLKEAGEHVVTLRAKNALGTREKKFRIVVGETTALTPPMGWNSWNAYHATVTGDNVIHAARAMASSGLIDHGWTYINIDDAWQSKRGGPFNGIQPNDKFPDFQKMCDQIHALGLKVGIYSTPWTTSYAGYIGGSSDEPNGAWTRGRGRKMGKISFAEADAKQWAAWGIDYLKYDWNPNSTSPRETNEVFLQNSQTMEKALRHCGRDVVYSYSNSMRFQDIADQSKVFNCWRTTGDISDSWQSMASKAFYVNFPRGRTEPQGPPSDRWAPFARPGHWNDPDMMVLGVVNFQRRQLPTRLTPDEQYLHMTAWCMAAAPLLLGCDLDKLDAFTLNLVTNDEVLAVNQDTLGKQATVASNEGNKLLVYARDLDDGSKAVALYNLGQEPAVVTAKWSDLKLSGRHAVRDLWRQKDLGRFADQFQVTVAPHGAEMVQVR
jgi:alpha-L-fucosidase